MAIAEDASTPAVVNSTGLGASPSATTASFTPPSNSLLVAVVNFGYAGSSQPTPSISVSDSGGHTWTAGPSVYDGQFDYTGIFTCQLGAIGGSGTVTASDSVSYTGTSGLQLAVRVVTGAAASQAGAGSSTFSTGSNTTAAESNITTTAAGSWVYVGATLGNDGTFTAESGTTTLSTLNDTTDILVWGAGRQSSSTGTVTPGSTSMGWTASGSGGPVSWAALEILPVTVPFAGTVAVQPSRTFQQFFRYGQRQKLVVPTWQPLTYADGDTVTGADGGEQITFPSSPVVTDADAGSAMDTARDPDQLGALNIVPAV